MVSEGSDSQAWLLTLASSLACVIGALFICADLIVQQIPGYRGFDLKKDKRFLVGGLSLGAGVLLFTALNRILPEGLEYLRKKDALGRRLFEKKSYSDAVLMASYLTGVVLCIALNALLHRMTPQSIIHCGDEGHEDEESRADAAATEDDRAQSSRDISNQHSHVSDEDEASTPLLRKANSASSNKPGKKRKKLCRSANGSACAGYTDPCRHEATCALHSRNGHNNSSRHDTNHETVPLPEHHHHVTQEQHDLMRIGLQTAVAISLHKLPEGFITFMSSHRDANLGFSIFLALFIHNFVEGFTIAFPLYLAFHSRFKAFSAACLLGGLSQPLGALIAWSVTRTHMGRTEDSQGLNLGYGILFGTTAGFMSVIAVSQLLPSAIKNDAHDGVLFTAFFFLGTAIIGLSGALTG